MQNKGAIRFFAIALALVCLYQLSFTFFSARVERKARAYAEAESAGIEDAVAREQAYDAAESFFLDSVATETVYNFFWIRTYTYNDCKEREINLGLDLKGGMNVMLEVSVYDVLMALSNHSEDPAFLEAMERARQMPPSESFVSRFGRSYKEVAPQGRLAAIFSTVELRDKIAFNATNEEVLNVLQEEAEGAISNSETIIRNRIDRFGVAQPVVQRLERTGRILVELPGVKDPERVRSLLQGTASLEFWETYDYSELVGAFNSANGRIRDIRALEVGESSEVTSAEENASVDNLGAVLDDVLGEDNAQVKPEGTDAAADAQHVEAETVEGESEVLASDAAEANKVNGEGDTASGLSDIVDELAGQSKDGSDSLAFDRERFEREYPLYAVLTPAQTQDGRPYPGPVVGFAHYRDTGAVNAMLKDERVRALFPRNLRLMWTVKPAAWDDTESIYQLIAIRVTTRDGQPRLDGGSIAGARSEMSPVRGEAEVSMWMNPEGSKIWARMTAENINKSIAIVLDNYVYSYPTVNTEIKGGRSSITGGFTIKEAKDLVNVLQSGKLPAPARIIQEEIVGPSLGQKAIDAGVQSFVISLLIILAYLIFFYSHRAGAIADFALLCNLFFILGILASFQATLTLPGIAGIVLTLGMAIDANVLIFERIKEELAAGKRMASAVDDGFKNALSAIIDGNVTTLLTGIILAVFGTGPIRGFATTLVIGILTSMFTAIFITRLIIDRFVRKEWKLTFSIPMTEHLFKGSNFDFVHNRRYSYVISGVLILAVIVSLFVRGFDAGVDFVGGRTYEVQFSHPVSTEEVADLLTDELGQTPQVKVFGESNQVRITTKYKIHDDGLDVDREVDSLIYTGLIPLLDEGVDLEQFLTTNKMSSSKVGPTIAQDLKREAFVAVVLALVAIFIYILLRFRNWRYSTGAVLGLAHNTLLVIGVYTLLWGIVPFTLEVDQSFIAAVLTIIGYSINDTVVIFDRIREYRKLYPSRPERETLNQAINATLSRTFSTSFSTLMVLIPMVLFGGDSIRGFVFSMSIGIIVGTYCSMFIAAPLSYDLGMKARRKAELASAASSHRGGKGAKK